MNNSAQPSTRARLVRVLVTLACLVAVATILWQLLPKAAFSSDLSQVGQGRPALVMLREVNFVGGDRVIEHMLEIYPDYEQNMVFLVVHTGNPTGQNFAAEHGVTDGDLVLFDAEGNAQSQLSQPSGVNDIRQFLQQAL